MNPWNIQNLEDLLVFHCPECNEIEKSREIFLNHALTKHENAKEYLEKFIEHEEGKISIKEEFVQVKSEIVDEEYFENYEDNIVNEPKIEIRNSDEKYCQWCLSSFRNDFYLNYHIKTVHNTETQVEIGKSTYENEYHISTVYEDETPTTEIVKNENQNACSYCGKSFEKSHVLKRHIKTIHEKETDYRCEICDTSYTQKSTLDRHIRSAHENENSDEDYIPTVYENETPTIEIDKKYKCDFCGKSFEKSLVLNRHVKTIHEKGLNYKCEICDIKYFGSQHELDEHMKIKHETKNNCSYCGKSFEKKSVLYRHIKTIHEKETDYRCEICDTSYTQKSTLDTHIKTFHVETDGERIKCETCPRTFMSLWHLKKHMSNKHNCKVDEEPKEHQCESCDRSFSHLNRLNIHIAKMHDASKNQFVDEEEEKIDCEYCQNTFKNIHGLNQHLAKVHSDLVGPVSTTCPYEDCGKTLSNKASLKIHILHHHEKQKNCICDTCGKAYQTPSQLRVHKRTIHEGQVKYKCKYCGKRYPHYSGLLHHVNSFHEGIKYQCEHCPKSFTQLGYLKEHIRVKHNEETPKEGTYNCDKCDKVYTFRAALRSHKRIVHEGKRLECQLCDKSYTDYTMLKKHMRKFHPIEFSQLKHRKKGKKRCFPDPEFDGPPSQMETEPTIMIGEKNESDPITTISPKIEPYPLIFLPKMI